MGEQEQPKKTPTPVPVRDLRQEVSGDITITIEPVPTVVKKRSQENRRRRLRDRPMMYYQSGSGLQIDDVDFAWSVLEDAACMIRVKDQKMGELILAVPKDHAPRLLQQLVEALRDHPDQEVIRRILGRSKS